eukprot:TRINITY_DN12793_c0_g1_i1.p1 TRINITY_DN12793_c0_g1~~TRINITY_DN12793_c0_g1_i1.p1  ORF type:complete len:1051 (+),score=313.58 TRINITY_DN12793_c0_g1_i1:69-3155(+)
MAFVAQQLARSLLPLAQLQQFLAPIQGTIRGDHSARRGVRRVHGSAAARRRPLPAAAGEVPHLSLAVPLEAAVRPGEAPPGRSTRVFVRIGTDQKLAQVIEFLNVLVSVQKAPLLFFEVCTQGDPARPSEPLRVAGVAVQYVDEAEARKALATFNAQSFPAQSIPERNFSGRHVLTFVDLRTAPADWRPHRNAAGDEVLFRSGMTLNGLRAMISTFAGDDFVVQPWADPRFNRSWTGVVHALFEWADDAAAPLFLHLRDPPLLRRGLPQLLAELWGIAVFFGTCDGDGGEEVCCANQALPATLMTPPRSPPAAPDPGTPAEPDGSPGPGLAELRTAAQRAIAASRRKGHVRLCATAATAAIAAVARAAPAAPPPNPAAPEVAPSADAASGGAAANGHGAPPALEGLAPASAAGDGDSGDEELARPGAPPPPTPGATPASPPPQAAPAPAPPPAPAAGPAAAAGAAPPAAAEAGGEQRPRSPSAPPAPLEPDEPGLPEMRALLASVQAASKNSPELCALLRDEANAELLRGALGAGMPTVRVTELYQQVVWLLIPHIEAVLLDRGAAYVCELILAQEIRNPTPVQKDRPSIYQSLLRRVQNHFSHLADDASFASLLAAVARLIKPTERRFIFDELFASGVLFAAHLESPARTAVMAALAPLFDLPLDRRHIAGVVSRSLEGMCDERHRHCLPLVTEALRLRMVPSARVAQLVAVPLVGLCSTKAGARLAYDLLSSGDWAAAETLCEKIRIPAYLDALCRRERSYGRVVVERAIGISSRGQLRRLLQAVEGAPWVVANPTARGAIERAAERLAAADLEAAEAAEAAAARPAAGGEESGGEDEESDFVDETQLPFPPLPREWNHHVSFTFGYFFFVNLEGERRGMRDCLQFHHPVTGQLYRASLRLIVASKYLRDREVYKLTEMGDFTIDEFRAWCNDPRDYSPEIEATVREFLALPDQEEMEARVQHKLLPEAQALNPARCRPPPEPAAASSMPPTPLEYRAGLDFRARDGYRNHYRGGPPPRKRRRTPR